MSFWGKLFGSSDSVNSMVDGVKNGLDAMFYTDEEKAIDGAKERSEARSMVVKWMSATQGQNLARRFLAMVISGVWLLQYIGSMALSIGSIWVEEPDKLIESSKVIAESADSMTGAMMLILGFYFAAPHMGAISKIALRKFGGKTDKK